ncbi:MAG: polyribonucleotide nucleotidyltransferase [Planctomycetota bacterium]|nr:MAG: polyribonucleotide nucleotidyltransferase [Planctomycetota bacterium]
MSNLPQPIEVSREIGGRSLRLETGRVARQATGSVLIQYGGTVLLAAATIGPEIDRDFFPLTVDYREKTYAVGRFPGGFFKREGRPTTNEIMTARLTDRPIRPMFDKRSRNEVSVQILALSADMENQPDVLAINAASAALALGGDKAKFQGPIGAVRIGRIGGEYIVNPTHSEMHDSDLDLVVAGTEDAITMVEAGAKEVSEEVMVGALAFAQGPIAEMIALQKELVAAAGRELYQKPEEEAPSYDPALLEEIERVFGEAYAEANRKGELSKHERKAAMSAVRDQVLAHFADRIQAGEVDPLALRAAHAEMEHRVVRRQILEEGRRADGRGLDEIRPITIDVGLLPRTHGSVLFTRGETQALVTATLGATRADTQRVDGLIEPYEKRFMLHYNFPSYSVGETWPNRGPKRREIGHGMLAERALCPVVPDEERFPYTIRVVSEITESNGSSSMASVCGGTLALMDAGVPIRRPVAGIAMGLVKEGDKTAILSDILGLEDAHGDMDFKVAGTQNGITALQMDIKIKGLSADLMRRALEQARQGRLHILRTMLKALDRPRDHVSPWAPQMVHVKISTDKIGQLIGPGGKVIRALQEETGTQIDIDDQTGIVTISGGPGAKVDECAERVRALTAEVEVGQVYTGKVASVRDFGAFVEILPGQDGMLHVSELSHDFIKDIHDHIKVGDVVEVKVIDVDSSGRVRLSRKALMDKPEGADEEGGSGSREREGSGRGRRRRRGGSRGDKAEKKESKQGASSGSGSSKPA